jgi:hypothetical protein
VILEGIVTTADAAGRTNVAPMGPVVDPQVSRLRLRPFRASTTFQNLVATGQGVFHVTDDVEMLARAAIGALDPLPRMIPLAELAGGTPSSGMVLADACRWYAFRVAAIDAGHERAEVDAQIVAWGRRRDFFGFNRAKHAVVEAAILATRTAILPPEEIRRDYARLAIMVEKTGGAAERRAFALLQEFVASQFDDPPRK